MNTITKTFLDCYLYNQKVSHAASNNIADMNSKAIADFITKSHRIPKNNNAFAGVIEDIKRQQTSSILLSTLLNDNVVLCIGDAPLPRSFSVFGAHDSKSGTNPRSNYRVFIDVTGKIEYKDGYYVAKRNEIDKLCALILDAMIWLMYRFYPNKMINSSNIILNATSCYVSMFTYIIDYLRIIGYSQNKTKIAYIIGLYFLKNVVGLELNDYVKSISAKVAGVSTKDAKAYDLYIESEDMFDNIGIFLPALVQTFKLKGLDLASFVARWMRSFGTGTEYSIELLPCFLSTVINAYTGCYIVQQRQIEISCGSDYITKLSNAVINIGVDSLNVRSFISRESSLREVHSINTEEMAKSIKLKDSLKESDLLVKSFNNKDIALDEAKSIIKLCKDAKIEDKIGIYAENSIDNGISKAYNECINLIRVDHNDCIYESGSLLNVAKTFKNRFTDKQRYNISSTLNRDINQLGELVREAGATKEINSIISKTILEMREIQQYI